MNQNRIIVDRWSNAESERLYRDNWPNEIALSSRYEMGEQCGGCSFFAPFDADFGLCCHAVSRHYTETVFEHFTCPSFVKEGWGPHSFAKDREFHCNCGGEFKTDG
jgi:hypothetical protein